MATTIASGAMTLSLDAEELYDGLKKAGKKTEAATDDMAKGVNGKGGGMFGGMLGGIGKAAGMMGKGGAFGVGLAAALVSVEALKMGFEAVVSGVEHVIGKVSEFKEQIKEGKLQVDPGTNRAISTAAAALDKVQGYVDQLTMSVITSFAPVFNMVADLAEEWLPKLYPAFEWLGEVVSTVMSIGAELFSAFIDGVMEVVGWVDEWIKQTFGLSDSWISIEGIILGVMRAIGKAGAYAWDVLKVGAGAVAVGVGLLVRGFGKLIEGFQAVVSLAKKLPSSLRPAGLDQFIAEVDATAGRVRDNGNAIQQWGQTAISSFGQSAAGVDRFIDGIADRARARREEAAREAEEIAATVKQYEYKAAGAVMKGSKEFASIKAKFTTEGLLSPARLAQEQLRKTDQVRAAVNQVEQAVRQSGTTLTLWN